MEGDLTFTSKQGEGTEFRFRFTLPVAPAPGEKPQKAASDLTGRKILLVEDNELNREIAMEILTEDGLLVTEACNGAEAVELLKAAAPGTFDAVLMDIQMPVMGGYEATRVIRKMEGDYYARLPIIAMTADAFAEDKRRALAAGMTAHISKPVNMVTLIETLSAYITDRPE
jgi:CheY-like chemotaxis protein